MSEMEGKSIVEQEVSGRDSKTVIGGPQQVPSDELPQLNGMVQRAFAQLGAKYKKFGYDYKRIVGATKQVVAGIKYEIWVDVGHKSNDETKQCKVIVWEKPWENFQQVTFECGKTKYDLTSTLESPSSPSSPSSP